MTAIKQLIPNGLQHDFLWFVPQMQIFASEDANICNPGCKYLRLNLQRFTSRENYLHLHQNLPSPGHNFVFFGAPERIIWAQELG